jgi:hypothetical protein
MRCSLKGLLVSSSSGALETAFCTCDALRGVIRVLKDFIVLYMMGVVFETFACGCPVSVKIFKDPLPALPILG